MNKIKRNNKCPCKSGAKFKNCCQPQMEKRKQDKIIQSRKATISEIIRKMRARLERDPVNERGSL